MFSFAAGSGEMKPVTQNLLAPLAGDLTQGENPTPLVHPGPEMLLDASALAETAATVPLIDHYTTSPTVCTLYEIIFGGLNIDSPSLNSKQS